MLRIPFEPHLAIMLRLCRQDPAAGIIVQYVRRYRAWVAALARVTREDGEAYPTVTYEGRHEFFLDSPQPYFSWLGLRRTGPEGFYRPDPTAAALHLFCPAPVLRRGCG